MGSGFFGGDSKPVVELTTKVFSLILHAVLLDVKRYLTKRDGILHLPFVSTF